MVNLIDHTDNETMKYCDQNNIDSMKDMFNTNKANLMRVHLFQRNYVKTWNSNASEVVNWVTIQYLTIL